MTGKEAASLTGQGEKKEPEQADIAQYNAKYFDFSGHMLRDYGCVTAIIDQQYLAGQPSAHGPAVSQDSGS